MTFTFSWNVERSISSPPLPEGWNAQDAAAMALLHAMAENPPRIFHLKDDEIIFFTDKLQRETKWEITLGGGDKICTKTKPKIT